MHRGLGVGGGTGNSRGSGGLFRLAYGYGRSMERNRKIRNLLKSDEQKSFQVMIVLISTVILSFNFCNWGFFS